MTSAQNGFFGDNVTGPPAILICVQPAKLYDAGGAFRKCRCPAPLLLGWFFEISYKLAAGDTHAPPSRPSTANYCAWADGSRVFQR